MAFEQKTWKDRIAEFINRRTLTKEDGTTEIVTVARNEGTISQEGDAFNAESMNDLEERIANGFEEVNSSLVKKRISYLGVCNNITQTACDIDFSSFDTVLLVLVKAGFIIGSTECIGINGVSAYSVMAKYSGVDYQGIAWVSKQKITSVIVSDSSVAMHMYGIKY